MDIFGEFNDIPETKLYKKHLYDFLNQKSKSKNITFNEIQNTINFYSSYVDILQKKNLISIDDCNTYKEIYPLFVPCYVFYDENLNYYQNLNDIYKNTFNLN
jgi:hypothetical protein